MTAAHPASSQPVPPGTPAERRRPFGVLVVALIQLGTIGFALLGTLASWAMPWEGTLVVYLQEHAWARGAILLFGVAVLAAVVGMWQLRYWGWALMVSLVGVSLLLDLTTWWQASDDAPIALYARLALDVVSAFYLNTSAVQDAFRTPVETMPRPIAGTESAGRVDP
ncbi:MAG: hypothetical protein U0667_00080 [Chloroflexota bacterium]